MSDQRDDTGRSVTAAIQFLQGVFREVAELLGEADAMMGDAGWQPTEKGRVSYGMSNANAPDGWVANYLFRFYVRPAEASAIRSLVGLVVRLDPPASFDQPVVIGVAAMYPAPTDWNQVFQSWEASDPTGDGLAATPGPRPLTPDEYADFLPDASAVTGLVVPLCHLSGVADLHQRVIAPLLAAVL